MIDAPGEREAAYRRIVPLAAPLAPPETSVAQAAAAAAGAGVLAALAVFYRARWLPALQGRLQGALCGGGRAVQN